MNKAKTELLISASSLTLSILITLDVILTFYGISKGFIEGNPIIKTLGLSMFLVFALAQLVLLNLFVRALARKRHVFVTHTLMFLIGWKLCVVMTWLQVML
jgi:Domain of unknown function (DUF5658)